MKYLKKFNEQNIHAVREWLSFEEAKEKIRKLYSEDRVIEMYDDEIISGNWIDFEQMEDEGYDTEYEYYQDFGKGEAEDAVMNFIISDIKTQYQLSFDEYDDDTSLVEFLKNEYDCLR